MNALVTVLLDNAIKYSVRGRDVVVEVKDENGSVRVKIESFGAVVPDEEVERIFEKGFRCARAKDLVARGSGQGLYIASVIARAHDAEVVYRKSHVDGGGNGRNIFEFTLQGCSVEGRSLVGLA
jgi:signal transduction histidine kinase